MASKGAAERAAELAAQKGQAEQAKKNRNAVLDSKSKKKS